MEMVQLFKNLSRVTLIWKHRHSQVEPLQASLFLDNLNICV